MKQLITIGLIGGCAMLANSTYAQTPEKVKKERPSNRLMEEVVVTAQKREENSQDIPITLNAFSDAKLDAFGIESTLDLGKITPGLVFTETNGFTLVYLRGVGTDAFLPSADPSVAQYIDGVFILPGQGTANTLGKVERIEVLKGPQGTLFGRNSTGGAISIITPAPEDEFYGVLKTDFGDNDRFNRSLFVNVPLTDGLAFTATGYKNQIDPYTTNTVEGVERRERKEFSEGARMRVRWDATDSLVLELSGTYSNSSRVASLATEMVHASILNGGDSVEEPLDRKRGNDFDVGNTSNSTLYSATVEWDLPWFTLKAIAADQLLNIDYAGADFDNTDQNKVAFTSKDQFADQISYELQFLSNEGTPFSEFMTSVFGLYYIRGTGGFPTLDFFANGAIAADILAGATGVPAGPATDLLASILGSAVPSANLVSGGLLDTRSVSAYFQSTINITSWLDLTIGGRYQEETRGIYNNRLSLRDPVSQEEQILQRFSVPESTVTNFSPKVAFQFIPNDDMQVFFTWSEGFKSQTYNTVNFFEAPDLVLPEETTAYELGIKSDWLDGALRVNGAIFKIETDQLVTSIVSLTSGGVVRFINAGAAETEGAEVDVMWQAMPNWNPGLTISGGATVLDATFTDFKQGFGFDDDTGTYFGPDAPTGDSSRDYTGNKIPKAQEFSSFINVNQRISLSEDHEFEVGIDYSYSGEFYFSAQNSEFQKQDQYELWGARLGYFYNPWGLQITAYGRNLKDEEYRAAQFVADFGVGETLGAPTQYGVKLQLDFDDSWF